MISCKDCEYSEKKKKTDGLYLPLQRCFKSAPAANSANDGPALYPLVSLDNDGCFEGKPIAAPKKSGK